MTCVGSDQHLQPLHVVVNVNHFILLFANGVLKYFSVKIFIETSKFT